MRSGGKRVLFALLCLVSFIEQSQTPSWAHHIKLNDPTASDNQTSRKYLQGEVNRARAIPAQANKQANAPAPSPSADVLNGVVVAAKNPNNQFFHPVAQLYGTVRQPGPTPQDWMNLVNFGLGVAGSINWSSFGGGGGGYTHHSGGSGSWGGCSTGGYSSGGGGMAGCP
jgi:hypothetical protein